MYALCVLLGLPSIVGIIAAILVLLAGHPDRWLWPRRSLGRAEALSGTPDAGARGARGPVITAGDFKAAFERFSKDEMSPSALPR